MTDLEVESLMNEFHVPSHVRRHCKTVCDFALFLGEKFNSAGFNINLRLLKEAALLHDLVRIVDFRKFVPENFPDPATNDDIAVWHSLRKKYSGRHHAEAAAEILAERGYKDLATIVVSHRFSQILKGFSGWEEKLLYYVDKRVMHDKIVSLKDRLEEGQKRNAVETIGSKKAKDSFAKVFELEKEISGAIGLDVNSIVFI